MMRQVKVCFFPRVCQDFSKQPRKAWRQLNLALGRNTRSPVTSLSCDGKTMTNTIDIVNLFARHFSPPPTCVSSPSSPRMEPISASFKFSTIEEDTVLRKLKALDERKATGPDGIFARILRMVAPSISNSLTSLFNASLYLGEFPSEWKQANVSPLPKSGDKHMVKNYCPISVLPVLVKIFGSLVHQQLHEYLQTNSILSSSQSGFRLRHNTQDVLLKKIDYWKIALNVYYMYLLLLPVLVITCTCLLLPVFPYLLTVVACIYLYLLFLLYSCIMLLCRTCTMKTYNM